VSRAPRQPGGRRNRLISEDDRALWEQVAKSVEPLSREARRIPPGADEAVLAANAPQAAAPSPTEPVAKVSAPTPPVAKRKAGGTSVRPVGSGQPARVAVAPATKPAGSLPTFERKRAKKVAAGRIAIDARIDLHGMRQADAHDTLVGFLHRSVARGCRTVLVITGKGGRSEEGDNGRRREPGEEPRGVLRRNVPRWLAEPGLAPLVVSYTEAHVRHGGGGALYIHLRATGRGRQDG